MNNLKEIVKNWGIQESVEILNIKDNKDKSVYKIVCIDNTEYLLKEIINIGKLEAEEDFLKYILNCNIPVSVPLRTLDNQLFISYHGSNYGLYKFINGNHLRCNSFEEYKEAVMIYGSILGDFHKVLKSYSGSEEYVNNMNLFSQVFDWALPIIEKQDKYSLLSEIVSIIKGDMSQFFLGLPKQYIHRDFHEDNIIFHNKKLIGIIDFETFMIGHKVYDICYILTSILLNNLESIKFRTEWIQLISPFLGKYINKNHLTDYELNSLWYVFLASQLSFIAWGILHNTKKLINDNLQGFYWIYDNKDEIRKQIELFVQKKPSYD